MNRKQVKSMLDYCILIEPLIKTHNSLKELFEVIAKNNDQYMVASYILRTMCLENTPNDDTCVQAYVTRKNVSKFRTQVENLISGFKTLLNYFEEFNDDPYHICGVLLNEKICHENDKCCGIFWKCYQDFDIDRYDLMDDGMWHDANELTAVERALAALECFVRITNAKQKNVSIHLIVRDIARTTLADFFKHAGNKPEDTVDKINLASLEIKP